MFSQILFYAIGISAIYLVYKIISKTFKEGKCAGCSHKEGCAKFKEINKKQNN